MLGLSVVVFLLTLDFLFDLVDLAIGKGVSAGIVFELFALSLGWMMALAVPCAVLIASLATFGRFSQDNEIAAMRANGVNLVRIIGAALAAAAILLRSSLFLIASSPRRTTPRESHARRERKRPCPISEGVFITAEGTLL
jgi:lipopolysaccharide export LptBFGC system permease protein LptF